MFLGDFFAFYTIPMMLNIIIYGRIAVTLTKCGQFESEKSKSESVWGITVATLVTKRLPQGEIEYGSYNTSMIQLVSQSVR